MAFNLTQTLINSHLVSGNMKPGNEIALRIDQALLQDVLGTLVMLELEAMRVERVRIDRAVQYVDHNLLETDNLNGDEHLFLRSACRRFGIWYSRAGNGISHPVHMQRFGKPGDTLIGSDSHTAAAGSEPHIAIVRRGGKLSRPTRASSSAHLKTVNSCPTTRPPLSRVVQESPLRWTTPVPAIETIFLRQLLRRYDVGFPVPLGELPTPSHNFSSETSHPPWTKIAARKPSRRRAVRHTFKYGWLGGWPL